MHDVITNPKYDPNRSLGWLAASWIEQLCIRGNGDVIGQKVFPLTDEYANFIVMFYGLESDGMPCHDHGFLSRPKGLAKSELAAFIGLFDALGPARFDHWAKAGEVYTCPFGTGFTYRFEEGEPVGRRVSTPTVQCIATEAGQAGEVYSTIYQNCMDGPLNQAFPHKDDIGLGRINIPGGGSIKPLTASGDSKDGGKGTLLLMDETHLWKTPELHNAYATLTRNLVKRRKSAGGTRALETSTMFALGEMSVAEQTYDMIKDIKAGKFKGRIRQVFDHRYSDITPEELGDIDRVREALTESYAEGLLWNDLDSLVDQIMDPRTNITASFRYFFNSAFTAETAWIASWEWQACGPDTFDQGEIPKPIRPGDVITMGFDGSRKRTRGVTDATALIGCRVSDGVLFPIEIWEQPPNYHGEDGWEVNVALVDAAVRGAFKKYNVVGFYCDPALWTPTVAQWEARYGPRTPLKASQLHPFERWMTGTASAKRTVDMLQKFLDAVLNQELVHFDDPTLTQHVLNCRRSESTAGTQIRKETPESSKKIDAAVASVLAWQARLDAVAKGLGDKPRKRIAVKLR